MMEFKVSNFTDKDKSLIEVVFGALAKDVNPDTIRKKINSNWRYRIVKSKIPAGFIECMGFSYEFDAADNSYTCSLALPMEDFKIPFRRTPADQFLSVLESNLHEVNPKITVERL